MANKNGISMDIPVDINLSPSLSKLPEVHKKLQADLSVIEQWKLTAKIHPDVELGLENLEPAVKKYTHEVKQAYTNALHRLGTSMKGDNNVAKEIKKALKAGTDYFFDQDGKLIKDKFEGLLKELDKIYKTGGMSADRGKSYLKSYLEEAGKDFDHVMKFLDSSSKKLAAEAKVLKEQRRIALAEAPSMTELKKEIIPSIARKQKRGAEEIAAVEATMRGAKPRRESSSAYTTYKEFYKEPKTEGTPGYSEKEQAAAISVYRQEIAKAIIALRQLHEAAKQGTILGFDPAQTRAALLDLREESHLLTRELYALTGSRKDALETETVQQRIAKETRKQLKATYDERVKAAQQARAAEGTTGYEAALTKEINLLKQAAIQYQTLATFGKDEAAARSAEALNKEIAVRQRLLDIEIKNRKSKEEEERIAAQLARKVNQQREAQEQAIRDTGRAEKASLDKAAAMKAEQDATGKLVSALVQQSRQSKDIDNAAEIAALRNKIKLLGEQRKELLSNISIADRMRDTQKGLKALDTAKKYLLDDTYLREINKQITKTYETIKAMTALKMSEDQIKPFAKSLSDLQQRATELSAKISESKKKRKDTTMTIEGLQDIVDTRRGEAEHRARLTQENLANSNAQERIALYKQQRRAVQELVDALERLKERQGAAFTLGPELANSKRQLKELEHQVNGLDNTFVQAGRALQAFLRYAIIYRVLYEMQAAFKSVATEIVNFQDALIGIKAVTQATANQMMDIEEAIKAVAESTAFTTEEISKGGQTLVQAGVNVKDFGTALRATANLASATGSTFEKGADVMTTFMNVFDQIDPNTIADTLANAVNISKLNLQDLTSIANYLLSTTEAYNISLNSTIAAATTLRNAGFKATTIATGSRQAILELLSPDKKALKALKERYAKLGIDVSEETVAGMFAGFKNAKNPILAAINELEKLGFGGLADKELSRVFEVRAENVIRGLMQNKEALIANEVALQKTGTAAEGAKIQLESLKNSFQNLGETVVTLFYDQSKGLLVALRSTANSLTDVVNILKDWTTSMQAATGESGAGSALKTGSAVFLTKLVNKASLARATGAGALVAGIQEFLTLWSDGNKTVKKFFDAIADITLSLSALSLLGKAIGLGKAASVAATSSTAATGAGALAGAAETAGAGAVGIGAALGMKAAPVAASTVESAALGAVAVTGWKVKLAGVVNYLASAFKLYVIAYIGHLVNEAKIAIKESIANLVSHIPGVGKSWANKIQRSLDKYERAAWDPFADKGESETEQTVKADALARQTQKAREDKIKAEEQKAALRASRQQYEEFSQKVAGSEKGMRGIEGEAYSKIKPLLDEASKSAIALGSQPLEAVIDAISKQLGKDKATIDKSAVVAKIQELDAVTQQGEALRKQYIDQLLKAYSDLQQDSTDAETKKKAQEIIGRYEKLPEAQQQFLQKQISGSETLSNLTTILGEVTPKIEEEASAASSILEKQLDEFFLAVKVAKTKVGEKRGINQIKGTLLQAVEDGNVEFLTEIANSYGDLLKEMNIDIKADVETAKANAKAKAKAKYEQNIKLAETSLAPDTSKLPEASNFQFAFDKAQADKAKLAEQRKSQTVDLESQIQTKLKELIALNKQAEAALEETDGAAKRKELDAKITDKTTEISNLKDTLASLTREDVNVEEKLQALKQSFVADESKLKDLQKQLKTITGAKLEDSQKEVSLNKQIFDVKEKELSAQKTILRDNLAKMVEKQGLFQAKGLSAEKILRTLSGTAGAEAMKNSKELSDGYKALADVVNEEKDLRSELTTNLENVFLKAYKNVEAKETKLKDVSDKLTNAREKLANEYEKAAQDETYFSKMLREVNGKKIKPTDVKADLAVAAETGSIEGAKQAAEQAKGMIGNGMSKSQAKSIIQQAAAVVADIHSQDIAQAQYSVDDLVIQQEALTNELMLARDVQEQLRGQLEALNVNVGDLIAKAQGQSGFTASNDNVSGGYSPSGYAEGGPITGPGSRTSDSIPILASDGEFMQPANAVSLYGKDLMEKIRNLQIDPSILRAAATAPHLGGTTAAKQKQMQPVMFNVDGAMIGASAQVDAVKQFQAALRLQAVKNGRRA